MNCKPGDLAIQTISTASNHGSIVRVDVFAGDVQFLGGRIGRNCWEVEYMRPVKDCFGYLVKQAYVPDSWLRPISGVPVCDEVTEEITA